MVKELSGIKYGEIVIFGTAEQLKTLRSLTYCGVKDVDTRFVVTDNPDLHCVAVARRPLVREPEREAYVAMHVSKTIHDFTPMLVRVRDCMCLDAPDFEMCSDLVDDAVDDVESDELAHDYKVWHDRFSAFVLDYVAANHAMPPADVLDPLMRENPQSLE